MEFGAIVRGDPLAETIVAYVAAVERGVDKGVREGIDHAGRVIRAHCPVRTGQTRRSIKAQVMGRGFNIEGRIVIAPPADRWWSTLLQSGDPKDQRLIQGIAKGFREIGPIADREIDAALRRAGF